MPQSLKNLSWSCQLLFLLLKCPIWNFDSLFKHLKYLDIHVCIFSLLVLAAICYMHIGLSSKMHYLSTPPTLVCFYILFVLSYWKTTFLTYFTKAVLKVAGYLYRKKRISLFFSEINHSRLSENDVTLMNIITQIYIYNVQSIKTIIIPP